ncbi:MAG: cytochrome b N-terminal domain-containing protein [Candidatus Krumholzibacteria bacterium]|nr:cytochrome b N-terminal domain-containing protein [Candidatus Krumholzibacteria bacterium]MDH4337329.1 cytochrome b N-terminal domain-containing protein [Candidatus Krumholzibacteria bacterium]MDH5269958.1 cytochrome b N-terminal domain-containing protein [Candidatus Krumholzibacteria bacterium]
MTPEFGTGKSSGTAARVFAWVDERFHISPLLDYMRHKQVPVHRDTLWYYMGGVSLFLFMVQVASGILLVLYYKPDEASAFESVRFISTKVSFGWLIRSVHSWSANLMVFFVFVHMFSTFFTRAYKKPRELTWMTGFVMLVLVMGFGFTGYLLPWNELAFFATKVGTDIAGAVPLIGNATKILLRGGEDVTGATLTRFYAIHIALLPAIFTAILGIHLLFVQRQGMHEPESVQKLPPERRKMMPFFPNFLLRDTLLWLMVLNMLLFLAVFFPWELGEKADPFASAPQGIRPEWYFMFMFQTLKLLPGHVWFMEGEVLGIMAFMVMGLAWMLVPFWEMKRRPDGRARPITIIGVVGIIYMVVLTIWGYLV